MSKKIIDFKFLEAWERAERKGLNPDFKELAAKLWPNASYASAWINVHHLKNGRTRRLTAEQVVTICNYLQCDANFLFGI